MFPSRSGLIRSLNISFVILCTNLVTIFRFVNYIEILVLNVSRISVKQFPTLIFWKIILFDSICVVHTRSNMQISNFKPTALKLSAKNTVQTNVLLQTHQEIMTILTPLL